MSYHNISNGYIPLTTNAQRQLAPPGYHYMPDGMLMSDVEHARLSGSEDSGCHGASGGKIKGNSSVKSGIPVFRICSYNLVTTYSVTATQNPIPVIYNSSNPWMISAWTNTQLLMSFNPFVDWFNQAVAQVGTLVPGDKIAVDNNVLQPSGTTNSNGGGACLSSISGGAVSGIANKFCLEYLGNHMPPQGSSAPPVSIGNYLWDGNFLQTAASVHIFSKFDCCKSFVPPPPTPLSTWDCVTTTPNIGEVSPDNLFNTFGGISQCVERFAPQVGAFPTLQACEASCGFGGPINTPVGPLPKLTNLDLDLSDLPATGERNYNFVTNTFQTANAQGQAAPAGHHYMPDGTLMRNANMPDGTLMRNADMQTRNISGFALDTSDIKEAGETRGFVVAGDNGAEFILEIKNEDNYYYNFVTNTFQVAQAKLDKTITGDNYIAQVDFPSVEDEDQYDVFLYAKPGTKHALYNEVRFADGSLDLNSSSGSNSLMIQKVIYQYLDRTFTISTAARTSAFTPSASTDNEITISSGKSKSKIPFTVTSTSATDESFVVSKQPSSSDVYSAFTRVVGSSPVTLPGEDIYPTVTGTDTLVAASGTLVTMTADVADTMKVGDKVTGMLSSTSSTATVVSMYPTGPNADPDQFTASESIDPTGLPVLSFSNQMNYSWPLDNINKITPSMLITHNSGDGAIVADTIIGDYRDTLTILSGTENEQVITKNYASALDSTGVKPTMVKGLVTNQTGNVVFNNQQQKLLAGDTINIVGYGEKYIADIDGYTVRFTDLAIALTDITTTTTSAVTNSASVPVTAGAGIRNTVSTVTGIGINPALAAPTVNSGATADSAVTIVLSAVQTLESGITLTFPGAGKVATITGNIEILKAGPSDATLYFDLEQLLTSA